MSGEWIYGVIGAVSLSAILSFFAYLKYKSSWSGVVTEIKRTVDLDDDGIENVRYRIYYRTDQGKRGSFVLNEYGFEKYFPDLQIDTRLVKRPGQGMPETVSPSRNDRS